MTRITGSAIATFRSKGYGIIPAVLDTRQLGAARAMVASLLAAEPPEPGHAGPYFLWPRFGAGGHPLLDLYRSAGIGPLAAELLRGGLAPDEPDFAQLAVTYPPYPHRPGGPHVDGITPGEPDGRPGTFSLLAGIWLTGQDEPGQGNLWVWPGSHLRFGAWLAEQGADALPGVAERYRGRTRRSRSATRSRSPARRAACCSRTTSWPTTSATTTARPAANRGRPSTTGCTHRATGTRWRHAVTDPLLEFRTG